MTMLFGTELAEGLRRHAAAIADWPVFFVCWYPHSGGRWLNRALLGRHPGLAMTEFFSPWLLLSPDDVHGLDRTSQVHKARSLEPLLPEFLAADQATHQALAAGMLSYLAAKRALAEAQAPGCRHGGALPCGTNIALPNLDVIARLLPKARLVQLTRDPVDCFASLKSRRELDGDPRRVATTWSALNDHLHAARAQAFAGRSALVRYEGLVADPEGTLRRLCADLDLPWDECMLAGRDDYRGRNQGVAVRDLVGDDERAILRRLTGPVAKALGYGDDGEARP